MFIHYLKFFAGNLSLKIALSDYANMPPIATYLEPLGGCP